MGKAIFTILVVGFILMMGVGMWEESKPKPVLTEEEQYDQWIESKLSVLDGSSYTLIGAIERKMKDPDSFEHISTASHRVDEETVKTINAMYGEGEAKVKDIYLTMTFRGNNSFGGKTVSKVTAVMDYPTGDIRYWMQP